MYKEATANETRNDDGCFFEATASAKQAGVLHANCIAQSLILSSVRIIQNKSIGWNGWCVNSCPNTNGKFMRKRTKSQFLFCDRWFDRHWIVRNMEAFQDLIVIALCLSLFGVMLMQLGGIFTALTQSLDYKLVTAKILFILILVELFRLLVIYLQEHSIAVGVAVEITIVSVLREVVVHGALEISWIQGASICALLLILGGLLIVCAKTPHMDCISANTKLCPIVYLEENQLQQEREFERSRQCKEENWG